MAAERELGVLVFNGVAGEPAARMGRLPSWLNSGRAVAGAPVAVGARPLASPEELHRILRNAAARAWPRELDSDREDLVQAAMSRVLEGSADEGNSAIRSRSELEKVAFHTMVDVIRRRNRRRAAGIESVEGPRSALAAEVSAPTARPEVSSALRECLAGMVSSRRHAVMLYLQGFTAREAAYVLHSKEKAIQNLVFRGIDDLRRRLVRMGVAP